MVLANTARQTGHKFSTDGHSPEEISFDISPEEGSAHGFYQLPGQRLGRYTAFETQPGITSIQASPTTLTTSTVPSPTPARTPRSREDQNAHPQSSHFSQLYTRDCTLNSTKLPQAPSPPEHIGSELQNRQFDEQKSLASLLQIQQQICDCSKEIMQPNRSHQDHSGALGKLFCATDQFISHVSQMCGDLTPASSSTPVSGVQSSAISNGANSSSAQALIFNSSIVSPSPNQKETLGSSHHISPFPSAAVFHIIMACHAHILMAYDTIISTTPSATLFPRQSPTSTTGECCFSIGSFTVRPRTSLESLLHLQVISHQLDHLNSTLYRYMMTDATPLSSTPSRVGPSKSSSSSLEEWCNDSLQEFAVQAVEQQGMALKGKIVARIAEM